MFKHPGHHLKTLYFQDLKLNYARFNKLIRSNPTLVQYSPGVQVIAWSVVKNGL